MHICNESIGGVVMNATKLKQKIHEKGFSVSKTASLIGISKSSLYEKINGTCQMTVGDAEKLKEILELTNSEASDIFLS